ncbi:MAG: glycoside hydrolase family 5 protein [Methylobacterium sp.]|uniref:glycoside hydrolase family 5 protein n=1 Tax=Methylobacterium sp. TaxID=409 RepID=UPI0025E2BE71|nr:cellulase family glycosylhydrolase [Methylobacterium sp.]MBX9930362.1 glycoside hydrolase family 5 protein [Methylobacterium sp.]
MIRVLLILGALVAFGGSLAEAGPAPFRRGVGVHSLLNWGALEPGRPDRYKPRPFDGSDYEVPDTLLRAVALAGFDFVRLTIDPGPFLQLSGKDRDALDTLLLATVRRLQEFGLGVVVDLHGNTQVPEYDPQRVIASADSALFRSYVGLVRRTSRILSGMKGGRLAFELMNEPPYGYDPVSRRRWQGMMETLHAAARAEAPDLLLVLTGSHGGDRQGLFDLDPTPFRGSAVLYSFHHYEPHDFTHQGVPEEGLAGRYRQYLSGLPYPVGSLPAALAQDTVRGNVGADAALDPMTRRQVEKEAAAKVSAYLASGLDRASIAKAFDEVGDWARRNGVASDRIFLGEFGATRSYDNHRAGDTLSYEAWIRDVRSEAEARGFGWAIWALTGTGGMAIVATDGGTSLDPGTLRALGLKDPSAP